MLADANGGKLKKIPRPTNSRAMAVTPAPAIVPPPPEASKASRPERKARPLLKHERAALDYARELRDRWSEVVSVDPSLVPAGGRYDVARLPADEGLRPLPMPERRALPAAA